MKYITFLGFILWLISAFVNCETTDESFVCVAASITCLGWWSTIMDNELKQKEVSND